jgi:16S rRNA (cytidine1402-2'-O)-methyltransferase
MLGGQTASLDLEMERSSDERAAYAAITESLSGRVGADADAGDQHAGNEDALADAGGAARGPQARLAGILTVAAVPIGQPADASARLGPALRAAALIAAEDTRRLRRLAGALGVQLTGRLVSYYDAVEGRRTAGLLAELTAGQDVLLVTDAGMPGVSDPGYRLVAAAAAAGIRVTVLPGPSAVTTAVVISGLPCDRFVFEGFPPRRAGERSRRFAELAAERRTIVLFESPRRLAATLAELAGALGPERRAAVCRELTKTHEEVLRGTLAELAERTKAGVLGEITLVIQGRPAAAGHATPAEAAARVAELEADGQSRKDAITTAARELGLPRRVVYDGVVASRSKPLER